MLATPVAVLPTGGEWAFEFKWDGVRALVDITDDTVTITSRTGRDVTDTYPELAGIGDGVGDALVDGEIVALRNGVPSFEALQRRMNVRSRAEAARVAAEVPATFVAFDLLRRYGVDLTSRSYADRRATLERWSPAGPGLSISPRFEDGAATEAAARQHGLEGVVAKRVDSRYQPGVRSHDWRKLRFQRTGDFAVIGWEGAEDSPDVLSSLLLATGGPSGLEFCGKAGSGLSAADTRRIRAALRPRDTPAVPVPAEALGGRSTHWVEPGLVVEVEYHQRTADGRLRQPVFRRIRADKGVAEVEADG
jgi:bifunctional non-homologous end joining protein LigD